MRVEFISADVVYRMTTTAEEAKREKKEGREKERKRNAFQDPFQEFQ